MKLRQVESFGCLRHARTCPAGELVTHILVHSVQLQSVNQSSSVVMVTNFILMETSDLLKESCLLVGQGYRRSLLYFIK